VALCKKVLATCDVYFTVARLGTHCNLPSLFHLGQKGQMLMCTWQVRVDVAQISVSQSDNKPIPVKAHARVLLALSALASLSVALATNA
jgi:hypothetical protein